jgi:serine/threonine-protein kinase
MTIVASSTISPLTVLSSREREVLGLMAEGRTNLAIGQQLGLSAKTVEAHVRSLFVKLGLEPGPGEHRRVLAVVAYLTHVGAPSPRPR